jgi:UDP-glucose 4-epimerase
MERVMEDLNKQYGFCATALRFFNVYGPRQDPHNPYSGVISLFMERAKTNTDVTVLGDGKQTRDFVYVKVCQVALVWCDT